MQLAFQPDQPGCFEKWFQLSFSHPSVSPVSSSVILLYVHMLGVLGKAIYMYTYGYCVPYMYMPVPLYMCIINIFFPQIVITATAEASDLPVFVDNTVSNVLVHVHCMYMYVCATVKQRSV